MTAGRTLGREEEARAVLAEYATRALERIPILDARHIFLGRLADFPSAIGGNPLFPRLPAVRAGRVDEVEGRTWT
ncbi:MAG: hypothetical protein K2X91_10305, partial [Thermoleophilia bacterium]|nr:hypothetical protein [Thermoleophilia bacterium]